MSNSIVAAWKRTVGLVLARCAIAMTLALTCPDGRAFLVVSNLDRWVPGRVRRSFPVSIHRTSRLERPQMALALRSPKARPRYGRLEYEGLVCNIIGYVTQLPRGSCTH